MVHFIYFIYERTNAHDNKQVKIIASLSDVEIVKSFIKSGNIICGWEKYYFIEKTTDEQLDLLIDKIKKIYESGCNYFRGEFEGEQIKIRMNKNHARNFYRNDDINTHNLSLINVESWVSVGTKTINKKVQMQADCVTDWDKALAEIHEFFNLIRDNK